MKWMKKNLVFWKICGESFKEVGSWDTNQGVKTLAEKLSILETIKKKTETGTEIAEDAKAIAYILKKLVEKGSLELNI
jgi:hypothetical protein